MEDMTFVVVAASQQVRHQVVAPAAVRIALVDCFLASKLQANQWDWEVAPSPIPTCHQEEEAQRFGQGKHEWERSED